MDWSHFFADPGITQYPDKNLYNAATMLRPDERPKVPVRMSNNRWDRLTPGLMWFDSAQPDHVSASLNSPIYKKADMPRLAAALAHEAIHSGGDPTEGPAYDKEAEVLRRFGFGNSQRVKDIVELKKRFK